MELKYTRRTEMLYLMMCSNRTFMELKSLSSKLQGSTTDGSNRTFMELKSEETMTTKDDKAF